MSLTRQGRHYLLIGGVQWLLDWGVMVALSHWGLPVEAANVAGRICGAMLGFWLNGRITFLDDGEVQASTPVQDYYRAWPMWRDKALAGIES